MGGFKQGFQLVVHGTVDDKFVGAFHPTVADIVGKHLLLQQHPMFHVRVGYAESGRIGRLDGRLRRFPVPFHELGKGYRFLGGKLFELVIGDNPLGKIVNHPSVE